MPRKITTVAIESPYAALAHTTVDDHVQYARLCMTDSLLKGEAPFLSHLLYTQALADNVPEQRRLGMRAGLALSERLDFAAIYYDLGISPGMVKAIQHYREIGKRQELRRLFSPAMGRSLRSGAVTLGQALALHST